MLWTKIFLLPFALPFPLFPSPASLALSREPPVRKEIVVSFVVLLVGNLVVGCASNSPRFCLTKLCALVLVLVSYRPVTQRVVHFALRWCPHRLPLPSETLGFCWTRRLIPLKVSSGVSHAVHPLPLELLRVSCVPGLRS